MAVIAALRVAAPGLPWEAVRDALRAAAAGRGVALRDVIVLVPYAALIEPLRAAFAHAPGWQPRIETTLTLAAALGPAPEAEPGQCSGEVALDRLQAAQWLQALPSGPAGEIDRGHAGALLADAATALASAAAERAPAERAAWHAELAAALPVPAEGGAGIEAALLRAAAAWAATMPEAATDALFSLRPAAWAVVAIGGADRLADAVLAHSACGGWRIELDPDPEQPFAPWAGRGTPPRLLRAADFESEAQGAAAEVLRALAAPAGTAAPPPVAAVAAKTAPMATPAQLALDFDPAPPPSPAAEATPARVALVALDRALVRRIAALLRRHGVGLDDETGWKLSTTAAAGQVLGRLRAALPQAGGDDRLDWLKRWPPARRQRMGLAALERRWRSGRNARLSPARAQAADALWAEAEAVLAAWQAPGERPLGDWLALLERQLQADGESEALAADAAGQRLLQLLQADIAAPAWRAALAQARVDLAGFVDWFGQWCELTTLPRSPQSRSRVVLTPLARAAGRPFSHVVLAGADAVRMGRDAGAPALIGEALAERLGLETAAQRRQRQLLALAQLQRVPGLSLLWRHTDEGVELAPAPELERLQAAWQAAGQPLPVADAALPRVPVPAAPVARPLPRVVPARLPEMLSASAVEALRQCPYRFFARSVLRVSEVEEVDQPPGKREYGDWLHACLHRFHLERLPGQDDLAALRAAAEAAREALALDPAALLAFRASLEQLLPLYLQWLAGHEGHGWSWSAGEEEHTAAPPAWAPQGLRGRVDRIDSAASGSRMVIDYKTGSSESLRKRLAEPLEDTQLAFYAALLQDGSGPVEAAYLALDDRRGPRLLPHAEVDATAAEMLGQLGAELERLRAGAALPALGEGSVCDYCEARGLCRRDHWPAEAT